MQKPQQNGTLVAARSLGWREISVARCPDHWDELQVKAFALADNRSAELAEWDEQVLNAQLQELELAEFDVEAIGFETTVEPEPVIEDEIPELYEAKAKLGQVWQLGRHRVMCGDSTNADDVAKLMRGDVADLIHADPPYGVNMNRSGKILNDNLLSEDLHNLLNSAFVNSILFSKDCHFYWWIGFKGYSLKLLIFYKEDTVML